MAKYRSIIETHNEMLKAIPQNKRELISDLNEFIDQLQTTKNPQIYLATKSIYNSYLRVLWKHVPNRPLKLSDPDWIWNCQEVFSSSVILLDEAKN
jgi:hypothetical protein